MLQYERTGYRHHSYMCPSDYTERKELIVRSVDVFYPTAVIDYVSVKLPKSDSNFLFSVFRITGRAPVLTKATTT